MQFFKSNLKSDFAPMLPTAVDFLRHNFKMAAIYNKTALNYDSMIFARACLLLDRAVFDYDSLCFSGSQLAAGVFWIFFSNDCGNFIWFINR